MLQKSQQIKKITILSDEEEINKLKMYWKACADSIVQVTNPHGAFEIDDSNRSIVEGLFWWFFDDPRSCYDLNKGILLKGGKGVGKTTLVKAFRKFFIQIQKGFKFESALTITLNYALNGNFDGWLEKQLVAIDEIGRENVGKYYGNELNVIQYILHERYNLWQDTGICTIVTTNLDSSEIEEYYGEIIRDRSKEMFNHIPLVGSSRRV